MTPAPIRRVVACLDSSPRGAQLARQAVGLANRLGVELAALWALRRPPSPACETFARGAGMASVLEHQAEREAVVLAEARRAFEAAIGGGTRASFAPFWSDAVADEAPLAPGDLIIVGHPSLPDQPGALSAQALLMQRAGPVYLTPTAWRGETPAPVLVAWNGAEAARRAIDDAMPLLKAAGQAILLVVDGAASPASTAEIAERLRAEGVTAEVAEIASGPATTAETIANAALDRGCGLIVMGGFSRSPTVERLFGGVTRAFLANPPRPLLLSRA